jgi:hypothetical protein
MYLKFSKNVCVYALKILKISTKSMLNRIGLNCKHKLFVLKVKR